MSKLMKEKLLRNKNCFVVTEGENWSVLCVHDKKGIVIKYVYLEI